MTHSASVDMRLIKGRMSLLLESPFFGTLLMRLNFRPSSSFPTMATDGKSIFYNPTFVKSLNEPELRGVLAHECMHPALHHHVRRGSRSARRWNRACDYAINPLILDAGMTLPAGALVDDRFRGMSAEQIYNRLLEEDGDSSQSGDPNQSANGNGGTGSNQGSSAPDFNTDQDGNEQKGAKSEPTAPETPGGFGQVIDAGQGDDPSRQLTPQEIQAEETEWSIAVEHAQDIAKARPQGKVPAGIERALSGARNATVNWREALRRAFYSTIPSDYAWTHPNRRHVHNGLYLPGIVKEGIGDIAIAVDCSGSISSQQLGLFEEEVNSILSENPNRVHVLYFDAEIHRCDVYEQGQPIQLRPVGGGGTDFCPAFTYIEQNGIDLQTLIFLTDLWGAFPPSEPGYPVIWASTSDRVAPFGETIPMAAA